MNTVYEVVQGTLELHEQSIGLYSTFKKAKDTVEGILEQIEYYQKPFKIDSDTNEFSGLTTWHWYFRNSRYDLQIYEAKVQ